MNLCWYYIHIIADVVFTLIYCVFDFEQLSLFFSSKLSPIDSLSSVV